MRRPWLAALSLMVASMSLGAAAVAMRGRSQSVRGPGLGPSAPRVVVEVLNATTSRGLAKQAATVLRARGFDVVALGTARGPQDTTMVLDRSGHPDWARRVASALKHRGEPLPRVAERPDTSRYLDITVVLGTSWRPPAEPFNP